MKHKLLSLVALSCAMFTSTSAFAQWEEPTEPEKPTAAGEFAVGSNYYIRNVGAGQYLTGGNSWSTQISLTMDGLDDELNQAIILTVEEGTAVLKGNNIENEVSGYKLKMKGSFTTNGASGTQNKANTYFFRDSETSGFIDLGSQTKGYIWNITKVGDYYRIQTAEGDPTFPNAATQYAGWSNPEGADYAEAGNTAVNFNLTEDDENIDWEFIPVDAYLAALDAYAPRKALYDLLVSTLELPYDVDTQAATSVYENASATKEDLEAAFTELKANINRAEFADLLSGATNDEPIEATDFVLENADFDAGNISGWTTNYVSGQQANNIGYQGASYTNGGVTISKFIEAWKNDSNPWTIGDGYLQQTVYGLPKGKYVLEADAISVYQWADHSGDGGTGKNPAEGVYLFIKSGDREAKQALATGNGLPEHFSITYVNEGADELTFGLKTESATANWIAADNFKIFYYGETTMTPAQADLDEEIKKAKDLDTDVMANTDVIAALEQAIEDAEALIAANANDDDCIAGMNTLKDAIDAFNASAKAYEAFDEYFSTTINDVLDAILVNDNWRTLAEQIEDYTDVQMEKFNDQTLTTEEATASIEQISIMIREYITLDNIEEGNDLTVLLTNASFSDELNGWTLEKGNATTYFGGVDYDEVESYHSVFDIYQVIPNMPKGVYNISVQGFVRLDDGLTAPTVELYAGNSTAHFKTINNPPAEYSFEQLWSGELADSERTLADGTTVYVPNGMAGAQVYFGQDNPETGEPFYQNTVKIVLKEDGDLRIGVRSNSAHEWVLWDNFRIEFAGNNIEEYYQMILDAQTELLAAVDAEGSFVTKQGADLVSELNTQVDNMASLETADDALALVAAIGNARTYILEGTSKGTSAKNIFEIYKNVLLDNSESSDQAYPQFMLNANDLLETPELIANNDAIDALVADIKNGWTAHVVADAAEEPTEKFDASEAIYNNNYENYLQQEGFSTEGWTIENIGGAQAANFSEMECYNNDTINVYQQLAGLKPGIYEIAVDGYYRAGFPGSYTDSLAQVKNVELYATTELGIFSAPLKNAFDGAQEMALGMGSESELNLGDAPVYIPNNMEAAYYYLTETKAYPNSLKVQVGEDGKLTFGVQKTAHINGDWTIFSNWQLFYLGKTGVNFPDEQPVDPVPVSVQSLIANQQAAQVFSIDGRQQSRFGRGVNIVRMSDGSVRKVMVK